MTRLLLFMACSVAATAFGAGPATQVRSFEPSAPGLPRAIAVAAGKSAPGFSVRALDDPGNPVPGARVTFALPRACASLGGSQSAEIVADADGVATSPAFIAGSESGECDVIAGVGGLPIFFQSWIYVPSDLSFFVRENPMDVLPDQDFEVAFALMVDTTARVPIANTPMTFRVVQTGAAGASIVGSSVVVSDANGAGSVRLHGNGSSGTYSVAVEIADMQASITVNQAPPAANAISLGFADSSLDVVGGQAFTPMVDVWAPSGVPLSGIAVNLEYTCESSFLACVSGVWTGSATTDATGSARFPAVAGSGGGTYGMRAYRLGSTSASVRGSVRQSEADQSRNRKYRDMWWGGPAENGWGMSIVQHGLRLFTVIFAYDAQGKPTWFVLPNGTWNEAGTAWSGALYRPRGTPWFAYDASRLDVRASVGSATLTFNAAASSARLDYTIDGVAGSKAIERQVYGPTPASIRYVGDMWWGGAAQNGWGIAILEQAPKIFPIWYTYDADGEPTWFVMPVGAWTATGLYEGRMYATTGSPWLGQAYDASRLRASDIGAFRLNFLEDNWVTFSYVGERGNTAFSLLRQAF
jgi:hypothetical protein